MPLNLRGGQNLNNGLAQDNCPLSVFNTSGDLKRQSALVTITNGDEGTTAYFLCLVLNAKPAYRCTG